jgi:site-specific DNA-methyltransferase (adenine-specific)
MNASSIDRLPPQQSSREEPAQETRDLTNPPELDLRVDLLSDEAIVLRAVDCIQGMQSLPDGSIDLVVTSPPYNIGVRYLSYKDSLPRADYYKWLWACIGEVGRVLAPSGSFFLNLGASSRNPDLPHEIAVGVKGLGLVKQNEIHWIKSISVEEPNGTRVTVGPFKPVNSAHVITNCHEYIFHISHDGQVPLDRLAIGIPFKDKSNAGRFPGNKGKDLRCRGNTWFIRYPTNYNRGALHPAQFPIELPEFCIRLHGRNSELVVLDPFVGTGSSAIAAKRCGVKKFIGLDVCQPYIDAAAERVANDRHDQLDFPWATPPVDTK